MPAPARAPAGARHDPGKSCHRAGSARLGLQLPGPQDDLESAAAAAAQWAHWQRRTTAKLLHANPQVCHWHCGPRHGAGGCGGHVLAQGSHSFGGLDSDRVLDS